MATLAPAPRPVKSAPAVVLFDATATREPSSARPFAAGLAPSEVDRSHLWCPLPYRPVAPWRAARLAAAGYPGWDAPAPSPRDFDLSGLDWHPARPKGYTAQDQADHAAGRTISAAELRAREAIEDDARFLANMPAEVLEESLYVFEA